MSGNELGLGSALSEEEGAVSPPSLFVLLLGHKKEHNLEGKNIYCAGCFGGSLGFDAANFGSCTVSGNLNVGSLNWKGITTITLDVLTAPSGHTKRTFFIQG